MDTQELAKSAVRAVKGYVGKALASLKAGLDADFNAMRTSFESLPTANDYLELKKAIDELSARPMPEAIKGDDGVVDMEAVAELIKSEVAKIPAPASGKDADMEAIAAQVKELVAAIPVPQDGKSITPEDVRPMLDAMVKALPDPERGQDGLDAIDIDILPAINDLKAYPRGVYARHNGGLWKTYKQTDGMDGWECVVDGIADIEIEFDGEQAISIKTVKSSGAVVTKDFTIPAMIYKGVWREGDYKKGHSVTWAGSSWVCNKDTGSKPGTDDTWQLAVKAGRDANKPAKIGGA